jgi:hypothetical protein
MQDLDRHPPAQADVVGQEDVGGRARADRGEEAVPASQDATEMVSDPGRSHRARVPCARATPQAIDAGENGSVRRRLIMTLIAAAAVGGLVFAFSGPTQERGPGMPPAVESVFPVAGNLELRQVSIVADLAPGYTGYLSVDGTEVPEDQVQFVDALNTLTLKPQPGGDFESFEPGSHCATVFYRQIGQPRENSSAYRWCFRLH